MQRLCFTMRVHPAHLVTYERMHREAWPELLVELDRTGWRDYSLFLRGDGMLVGYLESADWPRSQSEMGDTAVSARWSVEMDRLVVPGTRMRWLELVEQTGGDEPLSADATRGVQFAPPGERLHAPPPAPASARIATFRDRDGTNVRYLELPPGIRLPEQHGFRRVFDLAAQLAAATSGKDTV
jgi:L-rhamnose mutarotase